MKFATKPIQISHLTLGMLLHYLGKLKIQIFCRYSADMEENANKLHFECTGLLPIVRWSDREHLFVRKEEKVSGRLQEVLKQKLSVLNASSAVRVCPSPRSDSFTPAVPVTVSSCARRLLKHFRCTSLQLIQNTDDWWIPVSRDISPTVLWVCSLSSWLKTKSLTVSTFSSVRALRFLPQPAWPPVICARVPQLFQQLLNTTLCPAFHRKFVCQPLCCVSLQIQTLYQNLVLVAEYHVDWLTNTAVTSQWCDEFPVL